MRYSWQILIEISSTYCKLVISISKKYGNLYSPIPRISTSKSMVPLKSYTKKFDCLSMSKHTSLIFNPRSTSIYLDRLPHLAKVMVLSVLVRGSSSSIKFKETHFETLIPKHSSRNTKYYGKRYQYYGKQYEIEIKNRYLRSKSRLKIDIQL